MSKLLSSMTPYFDRRVLTLLPLGFSAGLPLMLVFSSLSFWLREADVSLSAIGFFSLAGLAYAFKWVWAPLVDGISIPILGQKLGKRRAWLLVSQIAIGGALFGMSTFDPALDGTLPQLALMAVVVAFCSATQDIVIDAYRIESAPQEMQGAMAATYTLGYRCAMIVSGAGSLALAAWLATGEGYDVQAWQHTYKIMALLMSAGVITTLFCKEPVVDIPPSNTTGPLSWLKEHVVAPFADFFTRYRYQAVMILCLIAIYRISDVVMGVMANPFYVDMGYSKEAVAAVSKIYGVIMTLLGIFIGGALIVKFAVWRILMAGAVLSAITNLLFSFLAQLGQPDILWLTLVISADNLSAGIASAAFIAYMSGLTNVAYSATQYALFSALMFLLPKLIAGFSGVMVESVGYSNFFVITALMGLPVVVLIWIVSRMDISSKNANHGPT
ncbi:AmpG family muropeptide MFS transporter [Echinimonas agarilytica]|uniref:MFS transporter n=1 Tax=Echinimonas agarilytica TaxID=1215918 RepID=A0AA41W8M8_9GAMM|nr:MFS transporter [Echinimonas agarilytica]MCM2680553.1 MFS transporter [Echinimonas agarilytica]